MKIELIRYADFVLIVNEQGKVIEQIDWPEDEIDLPWRVEKAIVKAFKVKDSNET